MDTTNTTNNTNIITGILQILFAVLQPYITYYVIVPISSTITTQIGETLAKYGEKMQPIALEMVIAYNEKKGEAIELFNSAYNKYIVISLATDICLATYHICHGIVEYVHGLLFLEFMPYSTETKWIEYCIKNPQGEGNTPAMYREYSTGRCMSLQNQKQFAPNTPQNEKDVYETQCLAEYTNEINTICEYMYSMCASRQTTRPLPTPTEKIVKICSIFGATTGELFEPLYFFSNLEIGAECLAIYNASAECTYMRSLCIDDRKMPYALEDFAFVKSRVKFLAVEYRHPASGTSAFLTVDPALFIVGNELLSYCHVWRMLAMIPSYKRPQFGEGYELVVIDGMANEVKLGSGQYLKLGARKYEILENMKHG